MTMANSSKHNLVKHQVKIGGMQCSFCTETIRNALSKMNGVYQVRVSLSHEEALIYYDLGRVTSEQLENTLRSLGYSVRSPDKLRSFEEEEADLRHLAILGRCVNCRG